MEKVNSEIVGKTEKKQTKPRPQWYKPGQSGNLKGHPKGMLNRKTVMRRALQAYAKEKGENMDDLIDNVIKVWYLKARTGSYPHGKDIIDTLYGPIKQKYGFEDESGADITQVLLDIAAGKGRRESPNDKKKK